MTDFPTYQDLFEIGKTEILLQNPRISREIIDRKGSDVNAFLAASATIGDSCIAQIAQVEAGLFLDSANGERLDRLVYDRYQQLRNAAAPARATVQFRTATNTVSDFLIPKDTRLSTADGVVFLVLVDTTFPSATSGPIAVNVQSVLSGLVNQVKPGTIVNIIDAIDGAPNTLTVTNSAASFGASDDETDDDFRERARLFYATAYRGTLRALEQGALRVPGVLKAVAFEYLEATGLGARFVQLVITDSYTERLVNTLTIPSTYYTQSDAIAAEVLAALEEVRCAGIPVVIVVASPILIGITLVLRFQATANTTTATIQARSICVNYVNTLRPNQPFLVSELENLLASVPGLLAQGAVVTPQGDIYPQTLQVLRTSLGMVLVGGSGVAPIGGV